MEAVIVVPTRNRADLAPTTIASALGEGDDSRVSVLVSDNSTDPEQAEQLGAWCAARDDSRLRYMRPPRPLPMSPHWQWALERALESRATTHAMYLTDRFVLRPGALEELLVIVERHPTDVITFGDDAIVDYQRPVTLVMRPWTGKLIRVDADHLLRVAARGIMHVALPTMLNSMVPRGVMEDIGRTYGNVFASIAPDHCFNYRCLDRVDSVLHWDRVLFVQRALARSNGFSQIRGVGTPDHLDFLRELGDSGINRDAPVPELLTVANAVYNEYEHVRREPASSKLAPLRRHYYLGANARDVARLEDPQLRAHMRNVLSEHGWSNRTKTRYWLGLSLSAAGYYWRRPRAFVRRLLRRPASAPQFGDAAQALTEALAHPSTSSAGLDHLWPIMSRPGAARELFDRAE